MLSLHVLDSLNLEGHTLEDKFQQKIIVIFTFALTFIEVLGQYSDLEIVLVSNTCSGTGAPSIMGDRCQKPASMRSN